MLTRMRPAARPLAALLGAAAVLAGAGAAPPAAPAAAARAARDCPAQRGTLARAPLGRVWHRGHSLYACTTAYARRPRSVRLGPWAPQTRVAWDGVNAAWTVPLWRGGA